MTKPVYIINGFLESGKTEFITFTLGQPYFQIKGKTLLILCEEGENEYDPALLKKSRTDVVLIEEEEEFTPNHLIELEKQYKPARIIIEYNGMWNCKNMTLPWYWKVEQQITTIDGSTFPMYYTNMKSLLAEMIRKSEMIIFNRCDGIKDLNVYKRNIKAVNPSADVIFEDSNGEIDEIFEEDLPYDLSQDPIVLDNQGYGIWYLDIQDHPDRYVGKTITFKAQAMTSMKLPKGTFIPGRNAMTCCVEDIQFCGIPCRYDQAGTLEPRSWVMVTAKITAEKHPLYKGEVGPVLTALEVTKNAQPADPDVATF